MIHVDKCAVAVTGAGLDVMTELGTVISSMAGSLKRGGADPEYIKEFFHHLVDVSLAAPSAGMTTDLSFRKEDGK